MLLVEAFTRILAEYPRAISENFKNHALADFLRQDLPELVKSVSEVPDEFKVEGGPGKGRWTRCPWVAVLDPLVTDTAQKGFYVVYLFREDFSGFYLSLNQGVTGVRRVYKASVKEALRARASDFRARLPKQSGRIFHGTIDLRPSTRTNFSADYEAGNILSAFYDASETQSESLLVVDLHQALDLYSQLSKTESVPIGTIGTEDDEQGNPFIEDYAAFRLHKRIERNASLSKAVKKIHGHVCQACGFDFAVAYPGIQKNKYIEAHHLVPIVTLKGLKIHRDPRTDFAVLCANCHRMIHRFKAPWDLKAFRNTIKIQAKLYR